MSFAGEVKTELCRASYTRKCCAQAECYGILLYSNTFSQQEVRIITESAPFAQRLPALLKKACRLTFDRLPGGRESTSFPSPTPKSSPPSSSSSAEVPSLPPCTSTSGWWRRAAAALLFSGGLFWQEDR